MHRMVTVTEATQVGLARREGAQLAASIAFSETDAGKAAIIITEIATNLVKHGGGGALMLRTIGANGHATLQVLGLDRGRGIPNVSESLRDGYSSAGSPGTGLGAVRRLSAVFDIYSQLGQGTAVLAEIGNGRRRASGIEVAAVSVPIRGESVCGDGWTVGDDGERTTVLVVDGLGHGALAADAAHESIRTFATSGGEAPRGRLRTIHEALRPTRGAAIALAEIDPARAIVRYAGIGNVAGVVVVDDRPPRHLVSHNGIAGHEARNIDEFTYPWPAGALLIMHTDGLTSRWDLAKYPGLTRRHPALIAGVLYRDFHRPHDDATVLVARAPRS